VFDERTSCMKPDLHVSVNIDAVENDGKLKSESRNMHLGKIFHVHGLQIFQNPILRYTWSVLSVYYMGYYP
jgi:hypothetical protein